MSKFDMVTRNYGTLPYMDDQRAALLRMILREEGARDILEIGFITARAAPISARCLKISAKGIWSRSTRPRR